MMLDKIIESLRLLTLAVAGVGLISLGVMAQDDPPPDEGDPETEEADDGGNPAWDDPVRLAELLAPDQTEAHDALQAQLDNEEITQEEFDAAISELDQELADLDGLIAELTPEQLYALNKFLNDTFNNGRRVNLGAEELQLIIDEEYGDREIRLLTKALEEEYKFTQFAERAAVKAEATGNEKFLDQEQRFLDRAEAQRDKFLDRIESDTEEEVTSAVSSDIADLTKDEVRKAAKDEVRGQVKAAAKHEAREAAKAAAKGAARNN